MTDKKPPYRVKPHTPGFRVPDPHVTRPVVFVGDRCGAFDTATGAQCVLETDHDGPHHLPSP